MWRLGFLSFSAEVLVAKSHLSWRVLNATADEADVDLFDFIGDAFEGRTGQDFAKEMRAIKASRINLHINSPGGYVKDALHMFAVIKSHKAQIVAYIESMAGSAASFVAMAADKVAIFPNAQIVIHDAHGLAIGNAKDMTALAALLDEESNNIAAIYAEKAGGTKESWRKAMQANEGIGSTYRGKDAVEAGLADEVVSTARNYDPARIAAYVKPAEPTVAETVIPSDLGAQFRKSATYTPEPTLEELFIKQAATERISVGIGATGGK